MGTAADAAAIGILSGVISGYFGNGTHIAGDDSNDRHGGIAIAIAIVTVLLESKSKRFSFLLLVLCRRSGSRSHVVPGRPRPAHDGHSPLNHLISRVRHEGTSVSLLCAGAPPAGIPLEEVPTDDAARRLAARSQGMVVGVHGDSIEGEFRRVRHVGRRALMLMLMLLQLQVAVGGLGLGGVGRKGVLPRRGGRRRSRGRSRRPVELVVDSHAEERTARRGMVVQRAAVGRAAADVRHAAASSVAVPVEIVRHGEGVAEQVEGVRIAAVAVAGARRGGSGPRGLLAVGTSISICASAGTAGTRRRAVIQRRRRRRRGGGRAMAVLVGTAVLFETAAQKFLFFGFFAPSEFPSRRASSDEVAIREVEAGRRIGEIEDQIGWHALLCCAFLRSTA
mmetsp:Transcript_19503/g.39746  ORF Transcript_19503/g.39746 Transcript_19503/m.39746 type:complete len:393 (+) Transcript_19503:135-1313(+)